MRLKKRLIMILFLTGFSMAVLFHFSINTTIIPDLKQQKALFIDKLKITLQEALLGEEKRIMAMCDSWAGWHMMSDYIEKPSPEFEKEFLSDSSFLGHLLNLVLVMDSGDRILFNKSYRFDVKFIAFKLLNIQKEVDKIMEIVKKKRRSFIGIINSEYGPLMIAASPITPAEKVQPSTASAPGLLMVGRFLDTQRPGKISYNFGEKIQPITFKENELFDFYLKQMQGKDFYSREDSNSITMLSLAKDVFGQPSIILKVESATDIFNVSKKHTLLYIVYTVLSILVLGILFYLAIGKYINKRIILFSSEIKSVRGLKDISKRINPDKIGDEISSLILDINDMLDKIEREKRNTESIEQRLITSEKLVSIGRLTASISHEINNPALAISNCLQALKKACAQCKGERSDLHRQATTVCETEINRIRKIVSDLLDYHRMEREEFSNVNLDEVILQSMEILKWSKKLNSIKIVTKKQQNFVVFGSHGKLKQVFINLILNSAEASPDNKRVLRIEMLPSEDKKFCEVHFFDNGPGIPEKIKNRIFEPFVSTKLEKGVGLGLYISYKIIQNHHGEIIHNDTYRQGTYFIIKLPIKEANMNPGA